MQQYLIADIKHGSKKLKVHHSAATILSGLSSLKNNLSQKPAPGFRLICPSALLQF